MNEPWFKATVDQDRGSHGSGGRVFTLVRLVTQYGDYSATPWEDLSESEQAGWHELLADLHAARVELANLPYDHRWRATDFLDTHQTEDLEDHPRAIRRAIAETAVAGR